MKKIFLSIIVSIFFNSTFSQTIIGKWKTIDDATGKARSIIKIYQQNDEIYGKIIDLLEKEKRDKRCIECEDERKDQLILGMIILYNLKKESDKYHTGKILHPGKGKEYRCKIWVDENNPDILNVRGYISFFYKTQQWKRVE